MPTPRETILAALHARLSARPAKVLRSDVLPERVLVYGLLMLSDYAVMREQARACASSKAPTSSNVPTDIGEDPATCC